MELKCQDSNFMEYVKYDFALIEMIEVRDTVNKFATWD